MTLILAFQLLAGFMWLFPMALFTPAVARIWRSAADAIDVVVSPFAFVAAVQVGFTIRWLIFPTATRQMGSNELIVWAGLYTLSALTALGSAFAWRLARRIR